MKGDRKTAKKERREERKLTRGHGMSAYGGNKGDESRSNLDYEGTSMYGGKKGDESKSRRDYEGTSMYGGKKGDESKSHRDYMGDGAPKMADSNRLQGAGSEETPGLGRMSMGPNKYDNAHNIGGPSMSGEKYDMKEAYNKNMSKSARFNYLKNAMHDNKGKGGSSLSKHFGRNRSKKR